MTPSTIHPFLMGLLRGTAPRALLPLASGAREWEVIIGDAAAHGLTPLLYRWLKRSDTYRRLPVGPAHELAGQALAVAARNMVLADELGTILRALEERRLPCAPLRGLALAERLYGDITARPIGDLDLLVHKEDLSGVRTVLRGLGFREMDRRSGFAQAFSYTLEFFRDRHGWIIIEPHWTITYPPFVDRVDMDRVWQRCVRGRVVGVETWLLGQEELLLHLCLHLAHGDGNAPLLWSYDLDRLLRQGQEAFDWSRVLSFARDARLEFLLSQALGEVQALLATPIPDQVLTQLTRPPSTSVEGRMVRLLGTGSHLDGKESLAVLFTLRGFQAKVRYALALLFPSPEFMRIQYGLSSRRCLGLAYFRRFCRLSRECLRGVVKLLFPLPRPQPPLGEDGGGAA